MSEDKGGTIFTARLSERDKQYIFHVHNAQAARLQLEEEIRKKMRELAPQELTGVIDKFGEDVKNVVSKIISKFFTDPLEYLPNALNFRQVIPEVVVKILEGLKTSFTIFARDIFQQYVGRGDYVALVRRGLSDVLNIADMVFFISVSSPVFIFNKLTHGLVPLVAANRYVESGVTGVYIGVVHGVLPHVAEGEKK